MKLVSAADKLHNARAVLADYREHGEAVFDRFKKSKDETLWYYRRLANTFKEVLPGQLSAEIDRTVEMLETVSLSDCVSQALTARASVYAEGDAAVDALLAEKAAK